MTLLLNRELVSRVKLHLVSAFPHIVKDCRKMRNLHMIFLISFENVGPGSRWYTDGLPPACLTTETTGLVVYRQKLFPETN